MATTQDASREPYEQCPEQEQCVPDRTGVSRDPQHSVAGLPAAPLSLVGAAEECQRCPQQDQQIGLPVVVADVPEVENDLLGPGQRGSSVDLSPAGDARA